MPINLIRKMGLLSQNPGLLFKKIFARFLLWKASLISTPVRVKVKGQIQFDLPLCPERVPYALGIYEIETLHWMAHFLRTGDVFVDVGANFGYLSAYAAACVGSSGAIHSFEPVPAYFDHLQKTAVQNPAYRWSVNPKAVGDQPGRAMINVFGNSNPGWNTLVPGFMPVAEIASKYEVDVIRLDDYLQARNLHSIRMIKIDTEGFEFSVLRGLETYLAREKDRPILFCEVCPMAAQIQGYRLEEIESYLRAFGYEAYSTMNNRTKIRLSSLLKTTDVIFRSGS